MNTSKSILLVVGDFYPDIADMLVQAARETIAEAGYTSDLLRVPGALEIPAAIARFAKVESDEGAAYAGFVALGCVIRGETGHYDIVANESARGLMDLSVRDRLAIGNGILTVNSRNQALARANPEQGAKGRHAAAACIALIEAVKTG